MPKGSSPQKKPDSKKSSMANAFSVTSREEALSNNLQETEAVEEIRYIRRTVTIATDLDKEINELVTRQRKLGKRENRSSIVETALRAYFTK